MKLAKGKAKMVDLKSQWVEMMAQDIVSSVKKSLENEYQFQNSRELDNFVAEILYRASGIANKGA